MTEWRLRRGGARPPADADVLAAVSVQHQLSRSSAHILELPFFHSNSFFKALANTCLITISTVPFPTSKCLLLLPLLLQLSSSLLLSAEATTPNMWQQHSGCAEKLPSYSKLQPQSKRTKGTWWLAAEVSYGDGKRGRESDLWVIQTCLDLTSATRTRAENLRVRWRSVCLLGHFANLTVFLCI